MGDLQSAKLNLMATLRHPNVSGLLKGQVIAAFGDRLNQAALLGIVVYMWGHLGSQAKFAADLIFWAMLPRPIFSFFAFAVIDRWNHQRAMVCSDVARAFLAGSIPLVLYLVSHHYGVYSVVFLIGVFSALFVPCKQALMPRLLPSHLLMSANAVSSQAGAIATLASMPIAGWVAEYMDRNFSFLVNALTYLFSAWYVWRLRPTAAVTDPVGVRMKPWEDFKGGLEFITHNPSVLFYTILSGCIALLSGIFMVAFFSYAEVVLGKQVMGTYLLFSVFGVGMVLGALSLIPLGKRAERFWFPMLMMICVGLGLYLLSFVINPWISALVLFVVGCSAVMVQVPIDTFLQKKVGEELRGRVFAAKSVMDSLAFLLSLQLSKGLEHQLGGLGTMSVLGLSAILIGVFMILIGQQYARE